MTERKIALLGAQMGWGAQKHETEWGSAQLQAQKLDHALRAQGLNIQSFSQIKALQPYSANEPALEINAKLKYIIDFNERLAYSLAQMMATDVFPVVIGGDHSIAMGTWSGVVDALDAYEDFALIWVDAHLDAHTPDTSLSQAIHGMPVAHLLGFGERKLAELLDARPKIKPEHFIYFGIRSFEQAEIDLVRSLGIRIYDIKEINAKGFETLFKEVIERLSKQVSHFGLTIDLDAFDPSDAPGVGSPEKNGLFKKDVLPALKGLAKNTKLAAVEIAEFNPTLDEQNKTQLLIHEILIEIFK
ncbi:arginase [Candidatus Berkiella cookevillensis]|uniref:Arginase n=1 Tax=Candidatus Berkiella cookevillensis TaxID=437022 RepID=A0A0Q9YRD8_9GAMM|nr:arginase [Candidatus Berkiella cookevillensis]MCS5707456.1 arginase [Candidatus Berkiella cookevillensis]